MDQHLPIRDMNPGQAISQVFVLAQATSSQSKNGPYWRLRLQDATGQLESVLWSPLAQEFPDLASGCLVHIQGTVSKYNDKLQLKVDGLRVLELDDSMDLSLLIPSCETPASENMARLEELLRRNIHYPPWRKLTSAVLGDPDIRCRLLKAPGGKAIHHAYLGGLLAHTLSVCRVCLALAEIYPPLDREILLTAAVFHDLGKAWELSLGLSPDYTDQGRLLGHILLGLEALAPYLTSCGAEQDLLEHLKHIIVSHHGFHEYGSPTLPMTAEAMVLHYADNLDAKMNQIAGAFNGDTEACWSEYQRSLERFLFRPRPTPGHEDGKRRNAPKDEQCSLLSKA